MNSPIFLSLPGDMATVHTQAGACDEGQKEDALGDEEAAKRVAILLPTVCWIVHVCFQDGIGLVHRAASPTWRLETVDGGDN